MRKSILNYTTSVSVVQPSAKIQHILAQHGVTEILLRWDGGQMVGMSFRINGMVFEMPARTDAVLAQLGAAYTRGDLRRGLTTMEHASRGAS